MNTATEMVGTLLAKKTPRLRGLYLQELPVLQKRELFAAWVRSDTFRLDDMLTLPMAQRYEATPHVVGCDRRGLREVERSFYITPKAGANVQMENGFQDGVRQHLHINKTMSLRARTAINAMLQFGPNAESLEQRGFVRELTEEEHAVETLEKKKRSRK